MKLQRVTRDHRGRIVQTQDCTHPAEDWPGCAFCEDARRAQETPEAR